MKKWMFYGMITILSLSLITAETPENEAIGREAMHQMMQKIYDQAMKARSDFKAVQNQSREDFLENLSSSAPREEFVVQADVSEELLEANPTAVAHVSTNGQSSWVDATCFEMDDVGYENTWDCTASTNGGDNVAYYITGIVDGTGFGVEYESMYVTQTPKNVGGNWPPGENLLQELTDEPTGDAPSDQDIYSVRGTYNDDRFYLSISMNGGCCDEGGLFGPWYLYGVGIVNPESEAPVAYAVGYGDGGFGQLTPGLIKIVGNLDTGEIESFDYVTTNISYNVSGNTLHTTLMQSYIVNDTDWGVWPNSYGGIITTGMTIEAGLNGTEVATEILDETTPGLMLLSTQFQDGNTLPILTDAYYNSELNELRVTYSDADTNLVVERLVSVNGTSHLMIPLSHEYGIGAEFVLPLSDLGLTDGDYTATFSFSDGDDESFTTSLDFTYGGGSECLLGDSNGDNTLNVLDVVLTVNMILCADCPDNYDACSDMNGDGALNVLDVVLLVNVILTP
jgi:hypothetical protein